MQRPGLDSRGNPTLEVEVGLDDGTVATPLGAATYTDALRWGAEVYHALKSVIKQRGMSTGIGDEGGFAPDLEHNRAALDLIVEAIGKAGFTPGRDIALAIDAAASEFYAHGTYHFEGTLIGCRVLYAATYGRTVTWHSGKRYREHVFI